MQTRLEQRLQELPGEGETEQKMRVDMAHKREYLEQTLLRISGATPGMRGATHAPDH